MSLSIEVQKKQLGTENRKVSKPSEVFELEEVKEIKDAIQEHLLFIGLDRRNNVRGISLTIHQMKLSQAMKTKNLPILLVNC